MAKPKEGRVFGDVFHLSVGAIIEREGKYLLIDRAKPPCGFACIAGHVDEGEYSLEALRREIAEESGLKLERAELLFEEMLDENECSRGASRHYWHVFRCTVSGKIRQNWQEAKSIGWYAAEELQKLPLEPVWRYWFEKLGIVSSKGGAS